MKHMNNNDFEKRVLESLSLPQKYAILLLNANNTKPIKGLLWYQKELYLLSKNIDKLEKETDFESDFMGPYSEIADEELEQLKLYDIFELEGYKLKLTLFGKKIANSLDKSIRRDEKEMISELKSLLNDMTQDELLCFIYYTYPEMTKESIKFDKIASKREKIALDLYRKGKISLGKTSEIAGLPIEKMIEELKTKGVEVYSH